MTLMATYLSGGPAGAASARSGHPPGFLPAGHPFCDVPPGTMRQQIGDPLTVRLVCFSARPGTESVITSLDLVGWRGPSHIARSTWTFSEGEQALRRVRY